MGKMGDLNFRGTRLILVRTQMASNQVSPLRPWVWVDVTQTRLKFSLVEPAPKNGLTVLKTPNSVCVDSTPVVGSETGV